MGDWDWTDWAIVGANAVPWVFLYAFAIYGLVQPDLYWWRLTRRVKKDMKIHKLGKR